ncbi:MAG: DUF2156 domain-containing protein [Candidatus Riflebacteria bacterium]|nr:DUF2156 domain-containing protein [Candidatus Riflebacteria bacterium]
MLNCRAMQAICKFPKQQELTTHHREIVSRLLFQKGVNSSDFAMYNLLGWYLERPPLISRSGDHIIIDVEGPDGSHLFLPPLGIGSIVTPMRDLMKQLPVFGQKPLLRYVPRILAEEIGREYPAISAIPSRGDFDYLYERSDLAELAGRRFHQKKNFVNRLIQEENPQIELLDGNLSEALGVLEAWNAANPSEDLSVCLEYLAARRMLPRLAEIGGIGVLVRIGGRPAGLSVASPIHSDCWVVTLEKADRQFKGIYQFLNWATVNRIPSGVRLINRETDLDIEGLRTSKSSYHPSGYEEKFILSWEENKPQMNSDRHR